jgi:imidazole glycerol-phosphate synthase subunit HisH
VIAIVDYDVGNLASIQKMLRRAGTEAKITADPGEIAAADKLILPGVGSFDYGITKLEEKGLIPLLRKRALDEKVPFLGICLGAQLLTLGSEEGVKPGLGWFNARTVRFQFPDSTASLKVPHMGWTDITPAKPSRLFQEIGPEPRFYFVHSYHLAACDPADIAARSKYGYDFVSALERENLFAVQFHPEKSHRFGLKLLKNFAELT